MANTLDAVLHLIDVRNVQQQQQADNFTKGIDSLNQMQQNIAQNRLTAMNTKVGAAQSGIAIGPNGELSYNPSLLNPLSQIMAGAKLQADAKTAGNPRLYNMAGSAIQRLMGAASGSVQPTQAGFQTSQGMIPVGGGQSATDPNSYLSSASASIAPGPMTPMSASTDPISGLSTVQSENIPAKVASAAATTKATNLAGAQTDAEVSQARDDAQMSLISQSMKNMLNIHKQLSDKGFAGNVYGPGLISNLNKIPTKSLQESLVPPDVQDLAGKFTSARNEAVQKVIPMLSQQFGKEGSSRIMDSLLDLAKGELGDLSTPHSQMIGQASGTLGSLYRIKLAGDKYLSDLKSMNQPIPKDEDTVKNEIYKRMGDLTPKQNSQLQDMTNSVLGKSKRISVIGPDGTSGTISENNLEEALKSGYKRK